MSLRVLALIPEAFGGHGGIALYNRDLLTSLAAHPDCERVVAIPRLIAGPTEDIPEGICYLDTGLGGKFQYLRAVVGEARRTPGINFILCGHINLSPIAYFLGRYFRVPVLTELYGIDAWQPTASRLCNFCCRQLHQFVAISDFTRKRFLQWTGLAEEQVHLLPNAIHMDRYGMGKKSPNLLHRYGLEDRRVIMTLGRLMASEAYKGVDEVLEVMPSLVNDIPDLCYLVVGDGSDLPRLREKARQLGLNGCVRFAGRIPEHEKAEHYRLADAFVMPGHGEGFGFVFLEALACGIPVVASSLDGSREAVLNGELGIVVDPRDASDLREGIRKALATPKKIPGRLQHFSFQNFHDRFQSIVDTASQAGSTP